MNKLEILNLDGTKKEDKVKIQKELRKIKRFSNISMNECISLELLEEYIRRVQLKYDIKIYCICPSIIPDQLTKYLAIINSNNTRIKTNIYAVCIYELYSKICLLYFGLIKSGKLEIMNWELETKETKKRILGV